MGSSLFTKILVPVDFSPCSEEALRTALALAKQCGAEVVLLHVVDTKSLETLNRLGLALAVGTREQKKQLRHQARVNSRRLLAWPEAHEVSIRRVVVEGAPFEEIAKMARVERVDLVVMGSYGGVVGAVDKILFGSTAEKVVRTATYPVLTVPLPIRRTRARENT